MRRINYRIYEEGEPGAGGGGTGEPAPADPPQDPPAAPPGGDWTANLNDELRGYVQNKGFEGPDKVVESYRNLEKLMGAPEDKIVKLPDAEDTEGWDRVYTQLGRPTEAKDYDLGETIEDENFDHWFRETVHGLGLTQGQAKALAEKMGERANATEADETMQVQEAAKNAERELRTEWGAAYEQRAAIVDRAAQELGMTNEQLQALHDSLGPADAMRFVYGLAHKLGEDNFISSGDGTGNKGTLGAMSPEQAQQQIKDLQRDTDFAQRLRDGDAEAKKKWDQLHRWAYPSPA